MAQDDTRRRDDQDEAWSPDAGPQSPEGPRGPSVPERGQEDARRAYEERRERMEEVEQRVEEVEEKVEAEGGRAASALTRDQLVEDAAIHARHFYGSQKHEFNPETGEMEDAGWYTLVDMFLIIPHILEDEYHGRFRRLSTVLGWESWFNRHLIPNKYVISMEGISKAIEENYVNPLFFDLWRYRFGVSMWKIGPPLAYFDWYGPSKEQAETWALQDILDNEPAGAEYGGDVRRQYDVTKAELEREMTELENALESYRDAKESLREAKQRGGDVETARQTVNQTWLQYRQVRDTVRDLKEKQEEAEEELRKQGRLPDE